MPMELASERGFSNQKPQNIHPKSAYDSGWKELFGTGTSRCSDRLFQRTLNLKLYSEATLPTITLPLTVSLTISLSSVGIVSALPPPFSDYRLDRDLNHETARRLPGTLHECEPVCGSGLILIHCNSHQMQCSADQQTYKVTVETHCLAVLWKEKFMLIT